MMYSVFEVLGEGVSCAANLENALRERNLTMMDIQVLETLRGTTSEQASARARAWSLHLGYTRETVGYA